MKERIYYECTYFFHNIAKEERDGCTNLLADGQLMIYVADAVSPSVRYLCTMDTKHKTWNTWWWFLSLSKSSLSRDFKSLSTLSFTSILKGLIATSSSFGLSPVPNHTGSTTGGLEGNGILKKNLRCFLLVVVNQL